MASDQFELEAVVPASPRAVYRAWLTGAEHTRMTGAAATGKPESGARFTAWDGYIEGKNLELEPGRRILQSWRSTEFPEGAEDSLLEVTLFPEDGGTRLVLRHSEIPEGQGTAYLDGWKEHYFEPMKQYFGAKKRKAPARRAVRARKATARKAGARKRASAPARKGKRR